MCRLWQDTILNLQRKAIYFASTASRCGCTPKWMCKCEAPLLQQQLHSPSVEPYVEHLILDDKLFPAIGAKAVEVALKSWHTNMTNLSHKRLPFQTFAKSPLIEFTLFHTHILLKLFWKTYLNRLYGWSVTWDLSEESSTIKMEIWSNTQP